MKKFTCFTVLSTIFSLVTIVGCMPSAGSLDSGLPVEQVYIEETLLKIEADPIKGFQWDYYLFIPLMSIPADQRVYLMVGPNNTGYPHDSIKVHDDAAYEMATHSWKNIVAREVGVPLLVPVFPRPSNLYTHQLTRDTLMVTSGPLARIDLQLIAMIRDAQQRLRDMGLCMDEKVLMNGYSACGSFVNRFTALHPYMVRAVASGGISGIPIFPTDELEGEYLRYPVGIADIDQIAGITFNLGEYLLVDQYIYMGSEDDDDVTYFNECYAREDAQLIWRLVGKELDVRWQRSERIYNELGVPAQFVTYWGMGHTITSKVVNDVVSFFKWISH